MALALPRQFEMTLHKSPWHALQRRGSSTRRVYLDSGWVLTVYSGNPYIYAESHSNIEQHFYMVS